MVYTIMALSSDDDVQTAINDYSLQSIFCNHDPRMPAALDLFENIKRIMGDHGYYAFLQLMKDFKFGRCADVELFKDVRLRCLADLPLRRVNTEMVIHEAQNLFSGHEDLLKAFSSFIPPGEGISKHTESVGSSSEPRDGHSYAGSYDKLILVG